MTTAPLLPGSLARWESAPSPDRAEELLEAAEAALSSGGVETADWHRWLDATRRREHLLALPDRAARHRWADAAIGAVAASGYGLAEFFAQRVAAHPGRVLFADGPSAGAARWSYARVRRRADAVAAALLGLEEEPRVAIVSENGVDPACVDLGCLLHGLLVAPLSPHLSPGELAAALDALGANIAVVSSEESLRRLREAARRVTRPFRVVLLDDASELAAEGDALLGEALAGQDEASVAAALSRARRRSPRETCTALFTSGSTGGQKGVAFSMENLVTKRFARAAALPFVGEEEVLLCFLPLYHTFGRYLEMLGTLFWGGTYVFAGNPSLDGLAAGLREVEPTGLVSIPIRWAQLEARAREAAGEAASPDAARAALREVVGGRLRWGLSAAGYLAPSVFRFFQANGVELCSGFGMTEATGGITMTPPGGYEEGSVGLPLPGVRVRLGAEDELEISGPYVARYLDDPEPAPGEERWLSTGDVFRVRESGHLEIVDRVKDIYKNSRGRTVAPRRVESRFEGVPGIRRVFLAGDGRDDNVLLVVPDAEDPVLGGDPHGEAARDYLRRIVAAANGDLATYERVVDFAVLPRDFSLERGELTPKGSYRRKAIEASFADVIAGLYRSRVVALAGPEGLRVEAPRWLLRDLGLLEGDLALEDGRLVDRRSGRSAALSARPGGEEVRIGSLVYRCAGRVVDLGLLARQPLLWVGNPELAALLPVKDGWETPLTGACAEVALPPREEVPEGASDAFPGPFPSPQLAALHRLSVTALFGPPGPALEAVARAEALLRQGDRRTAALLRRRLQALARHPDVAVRCEAYRVLLLDDPLVDTGEILPAFLRSGLPFLTEESVAAIARADLGEERLTALRRRLHSYREALAGPLPEATRKTLGDVLELLGDFARHHPEDHAAVRAELASWAIQERDPALARRADALFDALGAWHEETAAAAALLPPVSEGRRKLCYRDGMPEDEVRALEGLLLGTSFLRESIELAFETDPPDLADIPEGGIWVTPVLALHRHRLYRLSVTTAAGAHHDLLLTVRGDLDSDAVRATTLRMIALAGHPWGPPVVPRVGSCRPDLGALSLAWVDELTLAERLRDVAVPGRTGAGERHAVKSLVVRALSAVFTAWERSGRALAPAASPANLAVPAEDYREGACLLSLSGARPYAGPLDLVEPMLRNVFRESAALSPRLASLLSPAWIVDAAFEALGEAGARAFLRELAAVLGEGRPPERAALGAAVDAALAAPPRGRTPLALETAVARFAAWEEERPAAPLAEREKTAESLLRLYRVDTLGEEARYRLFRETVFARSSPELLRAFDELLAALRSRPGARPSHLVELEGLHAALATDEERHAFTRLVFPAARTSRPVEVSVVGDAVKHVVLATELVDRTDAAWVVREPVDAAEVGRLYRLFVRAGLPRAFSPERRYLVVLDSAERIAGGASYSLLDPATAQLDGIVVSPSLRGRGLSAALLDDLCARLASLGVRSLLAHFAFRHLPLPRFRHDRRHGGLVRDLGGPFEEEGAPA